ncbi:hypothetical protein VMCG_07117 [Cytospora schulzeri]|uniref:PHD-type domain-containing protein n=1 Tax=Cytospora schulzeri TaxID=448051 RepID=A0A423W4W9_9PEZI|nr:hypothetical protein VMCG_07117 [Valsa malicola]
MSIVGAGGADVDEEERFSPRPHSPSMPEAIDSLGSISNGRLGSFDGRADPDAQATVTDFLEFTEHLPADMIRSLTLIGTLDRNYADASHKLHELTRQWGQLPTLAPEERPQPVQLRADISGELSNVLTSRVYSHAEAVRMAENVNRHVNRLKLIHAKLRMMLDNYPAEDEHKSPVATTRSPQLTRGTKRQPTGGDKARRPRVPRITVPGEVLAPYDVGYDTFSGESDSSEEEEDEEVVPARRTPAARAGSQKPRGRKPIDKTPKAPKLKIPKTAAQPPAPGVVGTPAGMPSATEPLKPPPENAVAGSDDAPWLRLTQWELSKLRKRMKKNAAWVPSETMIHKELKTLGRGYEGWASAKKKAEEEGRPFENSSLPQSVVDDATGSEQLPMGAVSLDSAIAAEDGKLSNRGHELNKAKKIKKDRMSDIAAKEAEESARQFALVARNFQVSFQRPQASGQPPTKAATRRQQRKRKRDSVAEADSEKPDPASLKRSKTETPVPIPQPQHINIPRSQQTSVPPPQLTPGGTQIPQSTTPVPIPMPPGQEQSIITVGTKSSATSPAPSGGDATTTTTTVPTKGPADDVPPSSPKKSTTPILPPVRETRSREAKNLAAREKAAALVPVKTSGSRAATPAATTTGAQETTTTTTTNTNTTGSSSSSSRRPSSRGHPQGAAEHAHLQHHGLAADRPRRASTARNTPAPAEQMSLATRQPSKRTKRPAPGIISRTNSGGNSAITKRKAAPKKSKRGAGGGARKREDARGGQVVAAAEAEAEVEVDEDGNVIDPNEEKYCFCNRVSYGTMVLCENESCPFEWFHLECLGLKTEKNLPKLWYCPECKDGREGGRRTMSNYNPAYPSNVSVDAGNAGIKEFITTFYGVSDTPGKNQEWVDFYLDDATLVMAKAEATGKKDILKVREGMWEKVEARKHTVDKVFPVSFSGREDEVELMLYGNVVYRLKGSADDGGEDTVDWAGYARLVRVGGEWKFAYYRVYLQR